MPALRKNAPALRASKSSGPCTSGASILSSTVRAAGAVIVPREQEGYAEGTPVDVLLYDDEPFEGEGVAARP